MSKIAELIQEINNESRQIRQLTEELQEHYRVLSGLLLFANSLVPAEKWESWLYANVGMNMETAEQVIEGNMMEKHLNILSLPAVATKDITESTPDKSVSLSERKNGKKKRELIRR